MSRANEPLPDEHVVTLDEYEWHPHHVLVPRVGLLLDRFGTHTRLILPGRYLVRRSRSLRRRIYRRCHTL